ncbi:MAG: sugar transferase [bacterium]|nr:sugar transferase [bacterium]
MYFSPSPRRTRRPQLQISERRLLLIIGDVAAVWLAVLIALFIWTVVDQTTKNGEYTFDLPFITSQAFWFIALAILWVLLASANDLYDLRIAAARWKTFQRMLIVTAQMVVVYVLVFFLSPVGELPRLFILYFGAAAFVLIGAWRFARPALVGWMSEKRRVLIVGGEPGARLIIQAIHDHAAAEYDIRGVIGAAEDIGKKIDGVPVLGSGADLSNFLYRDRVSELIMTETRGLDGATFQAVMDAYEHGIAIVPMPILYERIAERVPVEHVRDEWTVVFLPVKNSDAIFDPYPLLKRMMDITLSLIGLVVFAVTFPVLALAIRIDSRGGVFYSQERVGRNGCVFRIWKYRSMIADAEKFSGAVFAAENDPRVTRVGRLMRKTRLDELPQLINVLVGDMSLVGPRPERPEHVVRLTEKIPFYRTRLIVRPGLTGWAQVRYDYGANDEDALIKLQYDLYYIRHQSILLDLNILLRTVGKVASMSGM